MSNDLMNWQRPLEARFGHYGVAWDDIQDVLSLEQQYGEHVSQRIYGTTLLTHAFHAFFAATLSIAAQQDRRDREGSIPYFGPILLEYLTAFRSLRAAETTFRSGYPLDGFALLRDVKERALLFSGMFAGVTDYRRLNALDVVARMEGRDNREVFAKVRRARTKEEHRVLAQVVRNESGLPLQVLDELERWERLFHQEVHGSRLTGTAEFIPWFKGEGNLSIGPRPRDTSIAMYANRSSEIGWMFLRLLPFLQDCPAGFGAEWRSDWHLLDDSFRVMVLGLEKPIAAAVAVLVDTKFNFGPEVRLHSTAYEATPASDPQ